MKKLIGVMVAVLVFSCVAVIGPVVQAGAQEKCATQGALALALAEMLKLKVVSAEAAAEKLSEFGIEPEGGWALDACVTEEVKANLAEDYRAAVAAGSVVGAAGLVDTALKAIGAFDPRQDVSPARK
jgi:hypothetical protein